MIAYRPRAQHDRATTADQTVFTKQVYFAQILARQVLPERGKAVGSIGGKLRGKEGIKIVGTNARPWMRLASALVYIDREFAIYSKTFERRQSTVTTS